MTTNTIHDYVVIIERLLDDALCVGEDAPSAPSPHIASAEFQKELADNLEKLQDALSHIEPEDRMIDRERLRAIAEKISMLERTTHARLSWFDDLTRSLAERGNT